MAKKEDEKRPERPVVEARVFHDDVTNLFGLAIRLETTVADEVGAAVVGELSFEKLDAEGPDPWPTAWLREECAQALADALQEAGITPSAPTEIVAVLQKQLEDMKEITHGLMDVLKTGQEG